MLQCIVTFIQNYLVIVVWEFCLTPYLLYLDLKVGISSDEVGIFGTS